MLKNIYRPILVVFLFFSVIQVTHAQEQTLAQDPNGTSVSDNVSKFFERLARSLQSLLPTPPDISAECTGNIGSDYAYRDIKSSRTPGKLLDCSGSGEAGSGKFRAKVTFDIPYLLNSIPFTQLVTDFSRRGLEINTWTYTHSTPDGTSPNEEVAKPVESKAYMPSHYFGRNIDWQAQQDVIEWECSNEIKKSKPMLPLEKGGIVGGIGNKGGWAKLEVFDQKRNGINPDDEIRDKVGCKIFSAYKKLRTGSPGDIEMAHDPGAGYVCSEDGSPKSVSIVATPIGALCRPMSAIEFFCENKNFTRCEQYGISASDKDWACTKAMGTEYGTGGISADSDIARGFNLTEAQRKLTPSEASKYGICGRAFRFISIGNNEDDVVRVIDHMIRNPNYDKANQSSEKRESIISLPINTNVDAATRLHAILTPFDPNKKTPPDMPLGSEKMNNSLAVSSRHAAANGNPNKKLAADDSSKFETGEPVSWLSLPDFIKNLLELPKNLTQKSVRDVEIEVFYTNNMKLLVDKISGYQGFATLLMPYDLTEAMFTEVNGGLPLAFSPSLGGTINYTGNASSDGNSNLFIPVLGGQIFAAAPDCGVMQQMVNNIYDPKGKNRTATCPDNQRADVLLRQYTRDTLTEKHFSQKITQQLASFNDEQLKDISNLNYEIKLSN